MGNFSHFHLPHGDFAALRFPDTTPPRPSPLHISREYIVICLFAIVPRCTTSKFIGNCGGEEISIITSCSLVRRDENFFSRNPWCNLCKRREISKTTMNVRIKMGLKTRRKLKQRRFFNPFQFHLRNLLQSVVDEQNSCV